MIQQDEARAVSDCQRDSELSVIVPVLALSAFTSMLSMRVCDAMLPGGCTTNRDRDDRTQLIYGPLADRYGKLHLTALTADVVHGNDAGCDGSAVAAITHRSAGRDRWRSGRIAPADHVDRRERTFRAPTGARLSPTVCFGTSAMVMTVLGLVVSRQFRTRRSGRLGDA
jgi:hypothetical protein